MPEPAPDLLEREANLCTDSSFSRPCLRIAVLLFVPLSLCLGLYLKLVGAEKVPHDSSAIPCVASARDNWCVG